MRRSDLLRATAVGLGLAAAFAAAVSGCDGWDPRSPFEHNAPEVDQALRELDAGRPQPASETLARYLGTGPCSTDAGLALPPASARSPAAPSIWASRSSPWASSSASASATRSTPPRAPRRLPARRGAPPDSPAPARARATRPSPTSARSRSAAP